MFSCILLSLSLSLSLSLWRLLSLQSCGDLLFAISFSLSEFMFCLSYRGSAHESVRWRACYLCRYSASRWHHARIYSSCFIRAYTPLVFMHLYSVCVSLSLSYTPVVFMHLYSLSRSYTPLVFMHLYSLSLSHSTYSVAMMEFARLCRFAVCNKFLPLSVSR